MNTASDNSNNKSEPRQSQSHTPLPGPTGILLVDKPYGWTSHDVVAKMRGVFKTKKIGHAGTLDPMATGLLVVLVGRATKLSDKLLNQEKRYLAEVQFGQSTDTGDAEGEVVKTDDSAKELTAQALNDALPALLGEREQRVPSYSAVKVGGKKLYELARKGIELKDRPVRVITIHEARLDDFRASGEEREWPQAVVEVSCTKGTYIRVLAEEMAEKVGTVAHLTGLRRTASGQFTVGQAFTMEEIVESEEPEGLLLEIGD